MVHRGSHALRSDSRSPRQIAGGEFWGRRKVAERPKMPKGDPFAGEKLVEVFPQLRADPDEDHRKGRSDCARSGCG